MRSRGSAGTWRSIAKESRKIQICNSKQSVLSEDGSHKVKKSGSLKVGEIVYLKEGDYAPADLLIIHTE